MAFTSADVDALDRAIATGELRVRFSDGREVTYRETSALISARSFIAQQLTGAASAADPIDRVGGVTFAEYDRR